MSEASASLEVRETDDGTVVIEVSGDMVVTNREELGEEIEGAIERRRDVIIWCADVDHIDTPSLALLVQLRQRCLEERLELSVAGLPSRFSDLLEDMRLREVLPLLDTIEEGLGSRDR